MEFAYLFTGTEILFIKKGRKSTKMGNDNCLFQLWERKKKRKEAKKRILGTRLKVTFALYAKAKVF